MLTSIVMNKFLNSVHTERELNISVSTTSLIVSMPEIKVSPELMSHNSCTLAKTLKRYLQKTWLTQGLLTGSPLTSIFGGQVVCPVLTHILTHLVKSNVLLMCLTTQLLLPGHLQITLTTSAIMGHVNYL